MNDQLNFQRYMQQNLLKIQTKNPGFSVRAFAIRLGLQPAAINEILKGERRVSRKMAEKILSRLHADPRERFEVLKHFPEKRVLRKNADALVEDPLQALRLSADQFQAISNWVHYAILSLFRTRDYPAVKAIRQEEWLAERLGVSESQVAGALERLERLSLVSRDSSGKYQRIKRLLHTTDDVKDVSIQKAHLMDLDLAKNALLNLEPEIRDFSSLMFPADPETLPKVKELLRKTHEQITHLMIGKNQTEVYHVATYVFPITKLNSRKSKKESV